MSGIAGIVHFDDRPLQPGQLESMTAAMAYRGPDGIRHWTRDHVGLGHCMLHATPESLSESQPLANEDGSLMLVLDGRLDNRDAVRAELGRGARLRDPSDAELVLRAYEAWGSKALPRFEGDFALAIWDARQRQLFCARDPLGNRQLHFHWNGASLAFATDLHALFALPWIPRQADEDTIAEYLGTAWSRLDATLWQGIQRLKPAHHATFRADVVRHCEYWAPDPFATLPCTSDQEHVAYLLDLLKDAVARTLRSHRPLAFEVSGGMDSSSIFAIAARLLQEGGLPAPGIHAHTLDFSGDRNADELAHALAVGDHLGMPIEAVPPSRLPLAEYRDMARRFRTVPDTPNGIAMRRSALSLAQARGARSLVSGFGGDEWLDSAGAHHYLDSLALRDWGRLRQDWREERRILGTVDAASRFMAQGLKPMLPDGMRRCLRTLRELADGRAGARPDWLAPAMRKRIQDLRDAARSLPPPPLSRRSQAREWRLLHEPGWQTGREMMERNLAVLGMDWRQPLLNRRIVEYAFATPPRIRARAGTSKWGLRQAMQGLLPDSVRLRPDKAEFSATYRQHWPELAPILLDQIAPRRREWVGMEALRALYLNAFGRKAGWNEGRIWMLFGLDAMLGRTPQTSESCQDTHPQPRVHPTHPQG